MRDEQKAEIDNAGISKRSARTPVSQFQLGRNTSHDWFRSSRRGIRGMSLSIQLLPN